MHTMVQEGQPGDKGGGGGFTQVEVGAYFKYIGGGCPVERQLITWGESTKLCYIAD